jgi:hypothetical protein
MFRSHRAVGRAKPPAHHFDVAQVLRGVPATEIDARRGAKVSLRVVRAPRRRNCIEQSTLDPEHEIAVGGDHGGPAAK